MPKLSSLFVFFLFFFTGSFKSFLWQVQVAHVGWQWQELIVSQAGEESLRVIDRP